MLSATDWLAVVTLAAPLMAKVLVDLSSYLDQRHQNALARIVGMAGREAALIARSLATVPPGSTPVIAETAMVSASVQAILAEMNGSVAVTGADEERLSAIVRGELAKRFQ